MTKIHSKSRFILKIEEKWWNDPRRQLLQSICGRIAADGLAMELWKTSLWHLRYENQPFLPDDQLINVFSLPEIDSLIKANLIVKTASGIYVRGSKDLYWKDQIKEEIYTNAVITPACRHQDMASCREDNK